MKISKLEWNYKKNQLCLMVKKVSDFYGGDDIEFLREYCKIVLKKHNEQNIINAIFCFNDLVNQLEQIYQKGFNN
jgi:hypothetical protein